MNDKYFKVITFENLFSEKILEKGLEVCLLDKVYDLKKDGNKCSCKVKGTNIYEVNVLFNDDEIDKISCTCPYAKKGNNCKHMYASLLKLTGNYNLEMIKKGIEKGLKELKQVFEDFEKDSITFKHNYPEFSSDLEGLIEQINCFKTKYNDIKEQSKENTNKITLLKDIFELKNVLYQKIDNFNEYIQSKMNTSSNSQEEYIEPIIKEKTPGLFGLFMNVLDYVNEEQEKKDKEYEEDKQRYRRAIIEQNLYEGKMNEDIYDGLDN